MLTFEAPDAPARFFLRGYSGREGVSELFEFELDLLLPAGESVAFEKLLGKSATVVVERGGRSGRVINGILCELEEVADGIAYSEYRAKLVPQVWRQTLNRNSRIFQQTSVPDVLKQIFPASIVEFRLRSTYDPHNFCVQYQESNFAFASRLMEEEGIFYYFEHERGDHKMIIADDSTTIGLPHSAPVRFDPVAGGTRAEDRIYHWAKKQRLGATRFRAADHQFQLPKENFSNAIEKLDGKRVEAGTVSHALTSSLNDEIEIYDHAPGFSHCYDGIGESGSDQQADLSKTYEESKRVAALRLQAMAAQSVRIQCQSDCAELGSGSRFELKGHPNADGSYLVLRVDHEVTQASPVAQEEERGRFANRLMCQPADLPFRPSLTTPKPSARSQSAVVVGPAGEEIFTDRFGRVKVQFHWDLHSRKDPKSSCWLRVVQPWAGSGFGHISIPRIGQEVVVDFIHGDPDMPFVVGSVHNPDEPTPRPLPDCRSQTVFKSRTKFGSANEFNGFGMDDTPSSEHLQLQAQKYMTTNVKDLAYSNYGSGQHETHGSVFSRQVGGIPFINYQQTTGSAPGGGNSGSNASDSSNTSEPQQHTGSGSGGESEFTSPNSGPFQWKAKVLGGWADNLEFTLGRKSDGILGLSTGVTVGAKVNSVINPLGLLWLRWGAESNKDPMKLKSTAGFANPAGSLEGHFNWMVPTCGNVAAILGTSTTLIYGPSIKVTRGHNIDKKLSFTRHPKFEWTKLGQFTTRCMPVIYAVVRGVEQFNFLAGSPAWQQNLLGLASGLVEVALLDLWTMLEIAGTLTGKGEAEYLTAQKVPAFTMAENDVITKTVPRLADEIKQEAQSIKNQLAFLLDPTKSDFDEQGVGDHKIYDGDFRVMAKNIKLASIPDANADPKIDGIVLSSIGPNNNDGSIRIESSQTLDLIVGKKGGIGLKTDAMGTVTMTLDCSSDGSISLQSGSNLEPNWLALHEHGIWAMSTQAILLSAEESQATFDPNEGVTLKSFEGKNKIVMGKDSISLVRGENSIEINDKGIVLNAKSITINSSGALKLDGGSTTWNLADLDVKSSKTTWKGPAIEYKPG